MTSRERETLLYLEFLSDILTIALAWIGAYYLRFFTSLDTPLGIPPRGLYFKLIPFIMVIWSLSFYLSGVYRPTRRQRSRIRRLFLVLQGCFFATISFIAFSYFYEEYRYSRITLLVFTIIHPVMILLGRRLTHIGFTIYRNKAPSRHVLIISSGESLRSIFDITREASIQLSDIVGIMFPKESPEDQSESIALCRKLGLQVIDPPENWASFFAGTNIQSVIIGLPHSSYRFLDHHLDQIANQVADVKIVPDILRFTQFAAGIEIIGETPVIHLHESPLSGFNCFVKRSVDIAGALMALLLFAPLMIMIALLVPFSSPGPIFYRQERMGLDGKRFQCLKFRTMPVDSEKETGAVWAKPGDQRATKLGSFLRRTSLDELPQLINVLRGDMSLVGPRPERPVFVNEFRGIVPGYMLRHKVKTGITGWAQVNGWRGSTSIHKRIECDLYYIQNWSIWLDFKILLMTIEEVLTGRNAY